MVRVKGIREAPIGAGKCARANSRARLQRKRCNTRRCKTKRKSGILRCNTKLDVVVLLDSSGSVGKRGWEYTKKAGSTIVSAFKTGPDAAQVSVLEFSCPKTWGAYRKCMR